MCLYVHGVLCGVTPHHRHYHQEAVRVVVWNCIGADCVCVVYVFGDEAHHHLSHDRLHTTAVWHGGGAMLYVAK